MNYQLPATTQIDTTVYLCQKPCKKHPVLGLAEETQSLQSGLLDLEWNKWSQFLDSLTFPAGPLVPEHVGEVRNIWTELWDQLGFRLRVPMTQLTPDGAVQLSWDSGRRYLDIDVYPDGSLAWFHRDRTTGELDGTEEDTLRSLPNDLLNRLSLLLT
jgi:hypothetical protein